MLLLGLKTRKAGFNSMRKWNASIFSAPSARRRLTIFFSVLTRKYFRTRFYACLQSARRNELPRQTLSRRTCSEHDRCMGGSERLRRVVTEASKCVRCNHVTITRACPTNACLLSLLESQALLRLSSEKSSTRRREQNTCQQATTGKISRHRLPILVPPHPAV
jgi:hypothetical protein